jgi:enoyl-CoA hydratase/carnithine racemase
MSTASPAATYETLEVEKRPGTHTAVVRLNRPQKRNAMSSRFWRECHEAFDSLGEDGSVRAIVLCGAGKVFSSGLDLGDIGLDLIGTGGGGEAGGMDPARKALRIKKHVTMVRASLAWTLLVCVSTSTCRLTD